MIQCYLYPSNDYGSSFFSRLESFLLWSVYYSSKIWDLFFTLGATSSGPVVWLTWLENMRWPHVVKLYPYLRGNRPFILPESLSIWKWENGKITQWWKEPLKSWGGKELRKCPSIYQLLFFFKSRDCLLIVHPPFNRLHLKVQVLDPSKPAFV